MYSIGHISREHRITISTSSSLSAMIIQIISSYYHLDGFLLVWAELKYYWIKPSPQAVNICDCNCWHGLSSPSSAACGCNCVTVCSNRAYVLMTEHSSLAGPQPWKRLRREDLRSDQWAWHSFKPCFLIRPSFLLLHLIISLFHNNCNFYISKLHRHNTH